MTANTGWVSVGTDHDPAEFAVETLRRWWRQMGARTSPEATARLVIADGGGRNGSRMRLWQAEWQGLADEVGRRISVCHWRPGPSKWNKIEHRMFAYLTPHWRGTPLVSPEVIVQLIGHTTPQTGLTMRAEIKTGRYAIGRNIPDRAFADLRITRAACHGEWHYTIVPSVSVN